MQLQGMDLNSFFLDAIDCEAIKIQLQPDSACFNDFLRQSSLSAMLTALDLPTLK